MNHRKMPKWITLLYIQYTIMTKIFKIIVSQDGFYMCILTLYSKSLIYFAPYSIPSRIEAIFVYRRSRLKVENLCFVGRNLS